ncbi:MAG: hypothetical protein QCH35_08010 [Methanomicrobiaceae archaeon]|nr:hypothetical protein [Methanomicrobiaceae archaeon]
MVTVPRHDTACPYCFNTERVRIRRLDGSQGLYCPSCKYIEAIAAPADTSPVPPGPAA